MSIEQRIKALEQRAPAVARADTMTLAEWVQWHTTGQQPERWLSSPAIQAEVRDILARNDAVDRMMADLGWGEYEQSSGQA